MRLPPRQRPTEAGPQPGSDSPSAPRPPSQQRDAGAAKPKPGNGATREIGERAIVNTLYRSGGEIAGRLASLALFAEVARYLGEDGLGAFVFAVAYLGFAMVAVDLGLDRYLLRAIARDRDSADRTFFDVIALKLAVAAPLFTLFLLGLRLVGYSATDQATVLALAPGVLADSIARTQQSLFSAHERGAPPALADAVQRILSAALGIGALVSGYGVVAIAGSYSIGSLLGVAIGFALMHRSIGVPSASVHHRRWRALAANSIPFAAQDTFTMLLARADALLLSVIATQAAVGRYGAAYRLFESTFFITYALASAFAAMYTYLETDGEPPLRFVFQRSIKLALVLLTPLAVAFAALASPIVRLIYGPNLAAAAGPLRLLAPCVVLMGVVILTTSLMVSRRSPRRMVPVTAVVAAINVALNLALIPAYSANGAAGAMLATEVIFAVWISRLAAQTIGGLRWPTTLAGAAAAGAAMAAACLLLNAHLLVALAAGTALYALVLLAVESAVSPGDVAFIRAMASRRLPRGRLV